MWNKLLENLSLARIEHLGKYFQEFPQALKDIQSGFEQLFKDLSSNEQRHMDIKAYNLKRLELRQYQWDVVEKRLQMYETWGCLKWRDQLEDLNEKSKEQIQHQLGEYPDLKEQISSGLVRMNEMINMDPQSIQVQQSKVELKRYETIWDKVKKGEEAKLEKIEELDGSPEFDGDTMFFKEFDDLDSFKTYLKKAKEKHLQEQSDPKKYKYNYNEKDDFLEINHG